MTNKQTQPIWLTINPQILLPASLGRRRLQFLPYILSPIDTVLLVCVIHKLCRSFTFDGKSNYVKFICRYWEIPVCSEFVELKIMASFLYLLRRDWTQTEHEPYLLDRSHLSTLLILTEHSYVDTQASSPLTHPPVFLLLYLSKLNIKGLVKLLSSCELRTQIPSLYYWRTIKKAGR